MLASPHHFSFSAVPQLENPLLSNTDKIMVYSFIHLTLPFTHSVEPAMEDCGSDRKEENSFSTFTVFTVE